MNRRRQNIRWQIAIGALLFIAATECSVAADPRYHEIRDASPCLGATTRCAVDTVDSK